MSHLFFFLWIGTKRRLSVTNEILYYIKAFIEIHSYFCWIIFYTCTYVSIHVTYMCSLCNSFALARNEYTNLTTKHKSVKCNIVTWSVLWNYISEFIQDNNNKQKKVNENGTQEWFLSSSFNLCCFLITFIQFNPNFESFCMLMEAGNINKNINVEI